MSHDNKEELSACYARLDDMDQRWQKACRENIQLLAGNELLRGALRYAAHSVDHTCLAGDSACKRCAIDELLEAKP